MLWIRFQWRCKKLNLREFEMSAAILDDLSDLELDEYDQATFAQVLRRLRRHEVAAFASNVRCSDHHSVKNTVYQQDSTECRLPPSIDGGSHHAVLTLVFADGVEWVLKIPAHGYSPFWTDAASRALTSEAQTMRLISQETTLPVPKVFAFDPTADKLGCPLTLMQKIQGKRLTDGWLSVEMSIARRKQ